MYTHGVSLLGALYAGLSLAQMLSMVIGAPVISIIYAHVYSWRFFVRCSICGFVTGADVVHGDRSPNHQYHLRSCILMTTCFFVRCSLCGFVTGADVVNGDRRPSHQYHLRSYYTGHSRSDLLCPDGSLDHSFGTSRVSNFPPRSLCHDDVIKWKQFPRYWPFVRGIHRSPVNSPHTPVTRSFGVFFDLRLNKRLSEQSWGWWFETPSHSLLRHCKVYICLPFATDSTHIPSNLWYKRHLNRQ